MNTLIVVCINTKKGNVVLPFFVRTGFRLFSQAEFFNDCPIPFDIFLF